MLTTHLFSLAILVPYVSGLAIDISKRSCSQSAVPFWEIVPSWPGSGNSGKSCPESSLPPWAIIPSWTATNWPTVIPTSLPSIIPISIPSSIPTILPSIIPTSLPSIIPTSLPTAIPTSLPSAIPTSSRTTSSIPSSTPSPVPNPPASSFKNVVFNSGVNDQPDMAGRFKNLQAQGVSSWIGFTLNDPSTPDPNLMANQIRMVLTEAQIPAGLSMVTGGNPPTYLQLLNEPDASFYGQTILSAQEAASALQPFFDASTSTTYISPAPAFPSSSWLSDFFSACNGCSSKFPIIAAHIYNPDPNGAIGLIQSVQSQFPDKKIWLTELAPASDPAQGCTLDDAGVQSWMKTVVGYAEQQPQIERVFWNGGEASTGLGDGGASCKVGLTQMDGTPTDLMMSWS